VAQAEQCDGVICGHIHQPANKYIDGIHYLNSGDWVESLSALVQHMDGSWEVIHYQEWLDSRNTDDEARLQDGPGDDESMEELYEFLESAENRD
jgi:hypothetical protein